MKRFSLALAAAVTIQASSAGAQIEPNSSYFQIEKYYFPHTNGDWLPYQASGFAQVPAPNIEPVIFMFPTVTVEPKDLSFYTENGQSFDPRVQSTRKVGLVTIRPKYVSTLPNETQIPAIAATLDTRTSISRFFPPAARTNGFPVMMQEAAFYPPIRQAIEQDYANYEAAVAQQQSLAQKYAGYEVRNATLQDVAVKLLIGGEEAASRSYSGTTTNLGTISIIAPTEFQKNLLLAGDYEMVVTSRFRDLKTAYISARFDAVQAVRSFVEETQRAITKSRASGFQVFGFGSRRTKMKTSIDQSLKTDDQIQVMQNTRVVMYDATESMIEEFESKFFPALSKQDVIDRHLSAAADAQRLGNLDLAAVHRGYAEAIIADNEMQETDNVAAAAALSAGDYAGFLAHGVRAINSSDTRANNFRRVESREMVIQQSTNWDQTRSVSAMREMSVPVMQFKDVRQAPRIGLCGQRFQVPYTHFRDNRPWGPVPQPAEGLMVTCVEANSPAIAAGLLPGMIVKGVGNRDVASLADFSDAINAYEPGDTIDFWVVQAPTQATPYTTERRIEVRSKRGWPVD